MKAYRERGREKSKGRNKSYEKGKKEKEMGRRKGAYAVEQSKFSPLLVYTMLVVCASAVHSI